MPMDTTLTWVRSILTGTPERWLRLATDLPPELLTRRPAPEEWSAAECLYHLIDVEAVYYSRLQAFQAGQDFPAFDPDAQGSHIDPGRPLMDVAEMFARQRIRPLEMLEHLSPQDFQRQVRHQELGPVRLVEMLNAWAAHDLNHTLQAEKALMQPFLLGCGPWLSYFEPHFICPGR